jgi:hypothetical protein
MTKSYILERKGYVVIKLNLIQGGVKIMKKRLFALFLVLTFVCAFGASSFANSGDYNKLRLRPGRTSTLRLYAKDMDSRDDDLIYSVWFEDEGSNVRCKLEVVDRTAGNKIIDTRYPRVNSGMVQIKDIIDPTHNYKVILTNLGSEQINGGFMIVVE